MVIVSTLVGVEALCLGALAIAELAQVDVARVSVALTTALFFGLYAAGLVFAAGALLRHKGWSRGPIVLAQLIQLGVAWSFLGANTTWVAVSLAVSALVCLGLALSPATTRALYPEPSD